MAGHQHCQSASEKHVVYEGGHGDYSRTPAAREALDWLDKYLRPVRQ